MPTVLEQAEAFRAKGSPSSSGVDVLSEALAFKRRSRTKSAEFLESPEVPIESRTSSPMRDAGIEQEAAEADPFRYASPGPIEATLRKSIPGLIARGVERGMGIETEEVDFGPAGNLATSVGGLLVDAPLFGLSSAAGKVVVGGLVKRFGTRRVTQMLSEKALPEAVTKAIEAGVTIGGYDAVRAPLEHYVETGNIDALKPLEGFWKGALVGATALGPASMVKGAARRTAAEMAGFAVAPPLLEGRAPTLEDVAQSVGTIGGLKLAGFTAQKLLTPEGARKYAETYPDSADAIAKIEGPVNKRGPMRQVITETGQQLGERLPEQEQRNTFRDLIQENKRAEIQTPEALAAQAAEEGAEGQKAEVEPVLIKRDFSESSDKELTPLVETLIEMGEARANAYLAGTTPPTEARLRQLLTKPSPVADVGAKPVERQKGTTTESPPPDVKGQGVLPEEAVGAMVRLPGVKRAVGKALQYKAGRLGGVPDAYLPNDQTTAGRVVTAMRPDKKSWLTEKLKPLVDLKNKLTRARESIPDTGEMAVANHVIRLLEVQGGRVRGKAIDFLSEYSRHAANPDDISLLTLKLVAEDQRRGLSDPQGPQKLGYGLDAQGLDVWIAKLNGEIAKNPRVQAALQARTVAVTGLVQKLVANGAPKEWLDNVETYWHRQVSEYRDLDRQFGGGGKTLKKVSKPFMRARTQAETPGQSEAEWYDPSANWVQAEASWIKDAHQILDTAGLKQTMEDAYDVLPALKDQAKQQGVDWRELIPSDHVRWVPTPGHTFYQAYTVTEKVAEGVQKLIYDDMGDLKPGQIQEVVALGRPQFEWVIPKGIAEHLDALAKKKPEGALGAAINHAHQGWKQWVTAINPKRSLTYGLSNFFGDLDPVVAAMPSALSPSNSKQAAKELWSDRVRHEGKSAALRRQIDNGVIGTGQTDIEVERLGRREDFDRLLPKEFSITAIPGNLVKGYVDFVLATHSFREDLLRSMVEREYLRKLNSGARFSYGASKREVIDALRRELGNEAAAAKLTLDLVGNYQDRSAGVKWMSRYVAPFARWTDINLRREPRLLWNLMREAYEQGGAGQAVGAGVRRAAIRAPVTAIKTGLLATKAVGGFAALYTAAMLWNNFRYPELEKGLSEDDQSRPHLIIGVRSDGTPKLLRNFSALGAFTDFLGINKLAMLVPEYLQKKISGERLVKDVGWEVINNGVQLLGPQVKTPFELATGKTYFPDIRHPRPSTPGETVSGVLGLQDEFKEAKGRLLNTGERSRPGRFMSPFPAGTDIRRTALTDAYAWRTRFLESIGKSSEVSGPRSKFAIIRESAQNADYEAFKEARKVYREGDGGRDYEDFLNHLRGIDPLSDRLKDSDERKFLNEYLRPDQVERVREARHYAAELRHRLWWWYKQAVKEEDSPQEQREYAKQVREERQRLRSSIRSRPERQEGEKAAEFRERAQDAKMQRERAKDELKMITQP